MYTNDLLQLQYLGVDLYHTSCIRHQSVFSFLGRCTHDMWLASAADRRAAINTDRNAAAFAADTPCSNRSIGLSRARGAHNSKPAARRCCAARWTDRQTDGRPTVS